MRQEHGYWDQHARPPLPASEAGELARRAAEGDEESRWAFTASLLPLVCLLAWRAGRRAGRGYLRDDLAAAGIARLHRSAHLYDPQLGAPSTFATTVCRTAFRDQLSLLGYPCRVPAGLVEGRPHRGRAPDPTVVAAAAVVQADPLPINRGRSELGDLYLSVGDDPVENAARREEVDRVRAALDQLTLRERQLIACRYEQGMTKAETGRMLGLSGERVRQIEAIALGKIVCQVGRREDYA